MATRRTSCGKGASRHAIALPLAAAVLLAAAAAAIVPRGYEAGWLLANQDEPALLADRMVARTLRAPVAEREISEALAADDPELAASFLELARERKLAIDPALAERVTQAQSTTAAVGRGAKSFAHGLVTGEPNDAVGLAGTVAGDLFVFGDIRDALREGSRALAGEEVDELILGLACVGLAVTAGTYASLGAGTPARVGLTVLKAARRSGHISARLAAWIGRSARGVVDMSALRGALSRASLVHPVTAVRAARDAVKVDKAGGLAELVGNVGRVQGRAGTRAALDGLKIAEGPKDVSRLAQLAAAKGGKTRAIIKLGGRAAIALTIGTFNLASWLLSALLAVFGFVSAIKGLTERTTQRVLDWRRARAQRTAALAAHTALPYNSACIPSSKPQLS